MRFKLMAAVLLIALSGPAAAQFSSEQEVILGREASNRFEKTYGLVKDAAMQERVARIGAKLAPFSGREDVIYSFKVADTDVFNALAFPGGFIYATKGLMKGLNDDEVAFVLGHELTHVAHRHSIKQMGQGKLRQVLFSAVLALNGGPQVGGAGDVALMVDRVVGSQYSQADESDADANGIKIMAAAGFDPVNAVLALRTFDHQKGATPGYLNTLIGSHPITADRVRDALDVIPTVTYKDRIKPQATSSNPRPGLDVEWTQALCQDVALADSGSRVDSAWSDKLWAQIRQKGGPAAAGRGEIHSLGPEINLSGYETQFLSKELPDVAQKTKRFGLVVVKKNDGSREVYLYWP